MLTLFGDLESGNVHKVQLLLHRLEVPYQRVDVSQSRGDTRRPEFLALNPIGKVPALLLDDGQQPVAKVGPSRNGRSRPGCKARGGRILPVFNRRATQQTGWLRPFRRRETFATGCQVISESGAILYLFGAPTELWPADERTRADVLRWMFFEQYSHEPALAVRRYLRRFAGDPSAHAARFADLGAAAARALRAMELQLRARRWIAQDRPTLADYALYPYTRWADEADVDLTPYPAVIRWLEAFESLPRFLPLRSDGAVSQMTFDSYLSGRG